MSSGIDFPPRDQRRSRPRNKSPPDAHQSTDLYRLSASESQEAGLATCGPQRPAGSWELSQGCHGPKRRARRAAVSAGDPEVPEGRQVRGEDRNRVPWPQPLLALPAAEDFRVRPVTRGSGWCSGCGTLTWGRAWGLSCCHCCPRCPNRPPAGSGRRCPATGVQGQLLCCSARAPGRRAMPGPAGCCNPGLFSSPRLGPTAGACCQGCRHSVPSFLPSSWLLGPGGEGGHEWVNRPQSHLLRHLHFLNHTTPSPLWVFIHVIPSTCNAPFPLRRLVNSYSSFNTPPRHQLL